MGKRIQLHDESDTEKLAESIWSKVLESLSSEQSGLSIALVGSLGAGKTTLMRNIAKVAGVKEDVTSPTYVLQHEYKAGHYIIDHWDVYRLQECPEELFFAPEVKVIRFVEWCDRFPDLLSNQDGVVEFHLEVVNEEFDRAVSVQGILK